MVSVAIVGVTGYSGIELLRLLQIHPKVTPEMLVAHSQAGQNLAQSFPHLGSLFSTPLERLDPKTIKDRAELVFLATPAGVSTEWTPQLLDAGLRVIDLSGDFRLKDPKEYEDYYKLPAAPSGLVAKAAYGLSELNRTRIAQADLIANPGCYPTAALLGILPALKQGFIDPGSIIIDAKSGISGAGRKLNAATQFCEINENITPYKVGNHQHIPEIEQAIKDFAAVQVRVSFTPQLLPITRGLMCTIYANLVNDSDTASIQAAYSSFYAESPFVRVRPAGSFPAVKEVVGANFCDLGVFADARTKRLTIVSVIDNLIKGAAGQAIQNMNIRWGWPENTGLSGLPLFP